MINNDLTDLTFDSIRCPFCGSDDETHDLECGCCATCDNCGHTFEILND